MATHQSSAKDCPLPVLDEAIARLYNDLRSPFTWYHYCFPFRRETE
jgi:hypothetical protein